MLLLDAEETRLLLVLGNLFSKVSEFNVDALIPDTREEDAEEEETRSLLPPFFFLCDFRFLPLAPAPFDCVVACETEEEESATENGIEEACEDEVFLFFLLFLFPFLETPEEDETAVEE